MRDIKKAFPGVQAITNACFVLRPGEIHALVGENGAGKSTLIKILTGAHHADEGEIRLRDNKVSFATPIAARDSGIATIYQEFSLIPALPVHANLFLGRESKSFINSSSERRSALDIFSRLGVSIDPDSLISDLSIANQQLVEIARALASDAQILVMDEPTAALAPREVEKLFSILRELKSHGIGIIFIGHRLEEIFEIADRITVMRDGKTIGTWGLKDLTRRTLIEQMVGRTLEEEYPKATVSTGAKVLDVKSLSAGRIRDISFSVHAGEVLGLAGLMGAGRTEAARLIFGADKKESGEVSINGKIAHINSPRDAIKSGICLLTEDRKAQGLILKASTKDNFALPNLGSWSRFSFIRQAVEKKRFVERTHSLNIRMSGPDQKAEDLSGGNQQKLLVARWLESNFDIIIFDEPTRGIDVGAKYEMYLLIGELARAGKAVIVISSDLPEILGISDRILVMREGHIAGEIGDPAKATQHDIMALAV
jgi:ribose transport system ATP-binding protein